MKGSLFLFHWNPEEAEARAKQLSDAGWHVEFEWEDGARGGKKVLEQQPDVVVFDLAKRSSHSRATAEGLRGYKAGRDLPMVFVDGSEENIEKTKRKVANGIYTTTGKLLETLVRLLAKAR
jgi:CheY-like chemotaxis protein